MSIPLPSLPARVRLASFAYNFPNWANSTPFSYQDGQTAAKLLESMIQYIDTYLVPYMDEQMTAVTEAWSETVTDILNDVINSSIQLQDTVVTGIAEDFNSQFYALLQELLDDVMTENPTNAGYFVIRNMSAWRPVGVNATNDFPADVEAKMATKFADKSQTYTKTEADAQFAEDATTYKKTEVWTRTESDARYTSDADGDAMGAAISASSGKITALETLTTSGRLGGTAMDLRYARVQPAPHAVFIGSSQSTAGNTWVEQFCNEMGYVGHNYSIGGGGFTSAGASQFSAQAATAIADTSYDKALVKFVFVVDMGNDVRGTANVSVGAVATFSALRTAYPSARIILIPAIWGNAADNNIGGRITSISQRVEEAVTAGLQYGVELVDYSWTWLMDEGSWMESGGGVHMNAAGYQRIARFMRRWMLSGESVYNTGREFVTGNPATINTDLSYWTIQRDYNVATLMNRFVVKDALAVDADLGTIKYGVRPPDTIIVPVTNNDTRKTDRNIAIYPTGQIRTFDTMPVGTYHVAASWSVI